MSDVTNPQTSSEDDVRRALRELIACKGVADRAGRWPRARAEAAWAAAVLAVSPAVTGGHVGPFSSADGGCGTCAECDHDAGHEGPCDCDHAPSRPPAVTGEDERGAYLQAYDALLDVEDALMGRSPATDRIAAALVRIRDWRFSPADAAAPSPAETAPTDEKRP